MRLVCDIGGTNARFALVEDGDRKPQAELQLLCADFPSLAPAMEHYLGLQSNPVLKAAVIAVANPITGDRLKLTNNDWSFSQAEIKQQFSLHELKVVNDFTAQAASLRFLSPSDWQVVGSARPAEQGPMAVLGPGTGLGVSGLIPDENGSWTPLQGEGGHVSVAARTEREFRLVCWAMNEMAESGQHVSAEDFVSGPGLERLFVGLHAIDNKPLRHWSAAEISAAAIADSDPVATESLTLFCRLLGRVAGDLALSIGAVGGVFIAGGIVPRILPFFKRSPFRAEFEAKGKQHEYVKTMATVVVTHPHPALLGAASLLP